MTSSDAEIDSKSIIIIIVIITACLSAAYWRILVTRKVPVYACCFALFVGCLSVHLGCKKLAGTSPYGRYSF